MNCCKFIQPYVQQTIINRPPTSKPKDPDAYDFKDEQLAKDYRKMWDKYHQMEALLKQKKANPDPEDEEDWKVVKIGLLSDDSLIGWL